MSHFSVLVIGEDVEGQLRPYSEQDEDYFENEDVTDDYKRQWEADTTSKIKDPDGSYYDPDDDRFYRLPTAKELEELPEKTYADYGYLKSKAKYKYKIWDGPGKLQAKVRAVPEGWEEVEVPIKEKMTFKEYVVDYCGFPIAEGSDDFKSGHCLIGENDEVLEVVRCYNPNAKWDWYEIGGRWAGHLRLKPGCEPVTPVNFSWGWKDDPEEMEKRSGNADCAYKKDIDFAAMREAVSDAAADRYDKAYEIFGKTPVNKKWEDMGFTGKEVGGNQHRDAYWAQPRCKAWSDYRGKHHTDKDYPFSWGASPDDFLMGRGEYIAEECDGAIRTFAVVRDGEWYERGDMGWWGMVSNEKANDEWNREFTQILEGLDDDTLLTIVDCHI